MKMKTGLAALVTALLLLPGIAQADELPMKAEAPIILTSPSAILCEASTGQVIFEKNADERRPVASVNKVMTILLTLEAVDEGRVSLEDQVTVSPRAASMGGSQAFLDAGERYKLSELLKTVIVASANDSAVALAEHLAGTEESFVRLMNMRAEELGLTNTHYANCTGLPAQEHYTTARDVAKLSAQLDLHPIYYRYSTIWMDEIKHRGGRVTSLTNTNRLIRFYPGLPHSPQLLPEISVLFFLCSVHSPLCGQGGAQGSRMCKPFFIVTPLPVFFYFPPDLLG